MSRCSFIHYFNKYTPAALKPSAPAPSEAKTAGEESPAGLKRKQLRCRRLLQILAVCTAALGVGLSSPASGDASVAADDTGDGSAADDGDDDIYPSTFKRE